MIFVHLHFREVWIFYKVTVPIFMGNIQERIVGRSLLFNSQLLNLMCLVAINEHK